MESKFKRNLISKEKQKKQTKIEYISLKNEENEEKLHSKKEQTNLYVLFSLFLVLTLSFLVYLVFYSRPIHAIVVFAVLSALFIILMKCLRKEQYNKTLETIGKIKANLKKRVYKEDENIEDRVYYKMNI